MVVGRLFSKGSKSLSAPKPKVGTANFHRLIDPRAGDVEDDASSTKKRKLTAIAGSMLAEFSLPKFILVWLLLIGLPALSLGLAPLITSAWLTKFSDRIIALSGIGSLLLVSFVAAAGWYGVRPLFRVAERSFWALQSVAVQPVYALFRESLSQLAEGFLESNADEKRRAHRRAATAATAGVLVFGFASMFVALIWPYTRWTGTVGDLASPLGMVTPALSNAFTIVGAYLALASLVWGISDATMDQPQRLTCFDISSGNTRTWRVAHLSDIHVVGERYGFRIESGRAGPQGNGHLSRVFERLDATHQTSPIDIVLLTGDMTDAGRSSEWAEFYERLADYPAIADRMLILPGNHDVNVVDRANPARLELPTSPRKQLRQMRVLSAMESVQGHRAHVFDRTKNCIGPTLVEALAPHRVTIASFADAARYGSSAELSRLWVDSFPQIIPPGEDDGMGVIILNSNAETNFSFTNALGLIPAEDVRVLHRIFGEFPKTGWIIALHHHLMEYPMPVKAFSERIGTALINGSWFVRQLEPFAHRLVVMHGHRHIDWIGRAGALKIVSGPSPVMDSGSGHPTYFHVHTLTKLSDKELGLLPPDRIEVDDTKSAT